MGRCGAGARTTCSATLTAAKRRRVCDLGVSSPALAGEAPERSESGGGKSAGGIDLPPPPSRYALGASPVRTGAEALLKFDLGHFVGAAAGRGVHFDGVAAGLADQGTRHSGYH